MRLFDLALALCCLWHCCVLGAGDVEGKEVVSPFGDASSLDHSSLRAWLGVEEVLATGRMIAFISEDKPPPSACGERADMETGGAGVIKASF